MTNLTLRAMRLMLCMSLGMLLLFAANRAAAETEYGAGTLDELILDDSSESPFYEDATYDLSLSIGIGVAYGPSHEGSDKSEVGPLPVVEISLFDIININPGGIEVSAYQYFNEKDFAFPVGYEVSFGFGYDLGRDESDERSNLGGLGDTGFTYVFNAQNIFLVGPIEAFVGITQHVSAHTGTLIDFGARLPIPVPLGGGLNPLFISTELGATWASTDYMREYYSVLCSRGQVNNVMTCGSSNNNMASLYESPFQADSGIYKFSASLGVSTEILENWEAAFVFNYARLLGDAADSPIVKTYGDENQYTVGFFTSYRFNWNF